MNISRNEIDCWCEAQAQTQLSLLKALAAIPAPSHFEDRRAEFLCQQLKQWGGAPVTDAAKNVLLPLGWDGSGGLCVMAHTDVVFPDMDALPVREEVGRLYAPGVGDDTANVTALLLCAKFFLTHPQFLPEPLLLVFNSCEEGLGNLKGVRQIVEDHGPRIRALVSFDCQSDGIISRAVGSQRWQITVNTPGGHSFSDFGSPNAIAHLSALVGRLYRQTLPDKPDTVTTFNVGTVSGGTSVNTIAQQARMTYEYRSDDRECLAFMARQFQELISQSRAEGVRISVQDIGTRPCGAAVPQHLQQELILRCQRAIRRQYPAPVPLHAASTDANIPLSVGIPAVTFGLYRGGGAHTREEYVLLDSLTPGLKIGLHFLLDKVLAEQT